MEETMDNKIAINNIKNFNQVIGLPGMFETGMDITIYESKLNNLFLENSIESDIKKRAILLSSVDEEIYKFLISLCTPNKPEDTPYDTLVAGLNKCFKPIQSYFVARRTFYQSKRNQHETVCQWGARVEYLASKCGFSSELSTVVRDIFVVGMDAGPIQDRLLEEDASKIGTTYSFLMEIATISEAAMNDKTKLKREKGVDIIYHKEIKDSSETNQRSESSKKPKVKRGISKSSNHIQKDYIYKDYECNNFNMSNSLETFKRIPKMIVFDLDFTLWPFLIDARANPTLYKKRDNKVIDYRGRVVNHYPAIPTILKFLSENNIKISVASRNAVTEGAKKLLNLFGWNKYFQSIQIYVGKKTNHIMRIKNACNIELEDMLFFDDEQRNIEDLECLGIVCVLVKNGMTMQVLMDGLKMYSDIYKNNWITEPEMSEAKLATLQPQIHTIIYIII